MNERIVALDIGDKRIGIAVSDPTGVIAQPHSVYTRVGYGPDARHIRALCDALETTAVVCGLPRNMDGSEGFQAQKAREFAAQLEKAGLTVTFFDERMTTVGAENALVAGGMRREQRRKTVDKVAAALILQGYLDRPSRREPACDRAKKSEETQMASDIKKDLPETEDSQEETSIVELVDEDGETVQFEHLMTLEHEDGLYVVLIALEDDEDEEEGEVVILKIEQDENGEDCYVTVEDDNVSQAVFDKFVALIEEEDDAAPEEE